jgi:hypothetical protein
MKYAIAFLCLSLLLTACDRHDAKLRKQITGTWAEDHFFDMTLASDGRFASRLTQATNVFTFEGTWLVKDDVLVMSITNATGTSSHVSAGSVDRMKIISVDDHHLVYKAPPGQIIKLNR